jgi:hypothetical protein
MNMNDWPLTPFSVALSPTATFTPITGEWRNKMCHTCAVEYYSALKKERNPDTDYNMDELWAH